MRVREKESRGREIGGRGMGGKDGNGRARGDQKGECSDIGGRESEGRGRKR